MCSTQSKQNQTCWGFVIGGYIFQFFFSSYEQAFFLDVRPICNHLITTIIIPRHHRRRRNHHHYRHLHHDHHYQ